jgi:molecular chaperone DnaJ
VPPGTQSGTVLRLRGEGIKSSAGQGDELVQVTVRTPEMLTFKERKLIEDLAKEFEAR